MAKILIIDDDESLLQIMSMMLKRSGHSPILASDGHSGIEIAQAQHPDMVIVDIMMPDLSGYEVTRILREDPATEDIPVMILTALSGREHSKEANLSGADGYLTKPVTRDSLEENVQWLLKTGARNKPAPLIEEVEEQPAEAPTEAAEQAAAPAVETPGIIAVVGTSSGVGATTLAINLALGTLQFGRAALLDFHYTGSPVAAQLQIDAGGGGWANLLGATPDANKRTIASPLMMHHSGIAVMVAPNTNPGASLDDGVLRRLFSVYAEGFRRIVVDLPDLYSPMSVSTLQQASHIVVVVGDDPTRLGVAVETLIKLDQLQIPGRVHIVINRTRPVGVTYDDVRNTLNRPVLADIPYTPEQVKAVREGTPMLMMIPNSSFARAVLYLASQL